VSAATKLSVVDRMTVGDINEIHAGVTSVSDDCYGIRDRPSRRTRQRRIVAGIEI
jgi:hypothetical protein